MSDGTNGAMLELDTRQLGDEPVAVTLTPEPTLQIDPSKLAEPARLVLRSAGGTSVYDRWITWKGAFNVHLPAGEYRATMQGLQGAARDETVVLSAAGAKFVMQ